MAADTDTTTTASSEGPKEAGGMLLPWADADGAPFWEYARRHELRVQACAACGTLRFPPRPCCPSCQAFDSDWRAVSGRGRIWSFVIAHPPLLPAYAAQAPYNAIVVELAEDPLIRMVGNLVATPDGPLNEVPPDRLRIGAAVRVCFHEAAGGVTVPRWRLERR